MLPAAVTIRANELGEQAWSRVEPLLSLRANEKEYIVAIHRGDIMLDLLFPDDAEEAARLARHPAILWKIENVRAYRARIGQSPNNREPRKESEMD
jgi:hypothetical protein